MPMGTLCRVKRICSQSCWHVKGNQQGSIKLPELAIVRGSLAVPV
jgi:hypothetical protein